MKKIAFGYFISMKRDFNSSFHFQNSANRIKYNSNEFKALGKLRRTKTEYPGIMVNRTFTPQVSSYLRCKEFIGRFRAL